MAGSFPTATPAGRLGDVPGTSRGFATLCGVFYAAAWTGDAAAQASRAAAQVSSDRQSPSAPRRT